MKAKKEMREVVYFLRNCKVINIKCATRCSLLLQSVTSKELLYCILDKSLTNPVGEHKASLIQHPKWAEQRHD